MTADNWRMRRIAGVVLGLLLVAGAASCGQSKYHIVANGQEKAYFKLPRDWKVYKLPTGRSDRLSPNAPEDVELLWSVGFDGDPVPDQDHLGAATSFESPGTDYPVGVASVYLVQGSFNQNVSLAAARAAPLGFDPLNVPDDVKDLVEVLSYEPARRDDGLHGSRVRFNMRPNAAAPWRTYDMTTYFDPGRFRMYTFVIGCLGPCFRDRDHQIADIANSWSVTP
jgi:hypothetical protein